MPVLASLCSTPRLEPDDAVLGKYRRDARDPELCRLLDHEVHAIAARNALHEMNPERRLGAHVDRLPDAQRNRVLLNSLDRGRAFEALAVEDADLVASARAQHAPEVPCPVALDLDRSAVDQRAGNK